MEASVDSIATTRLKREDHKRTKHDSAFSDWKILIGSSDWEDHLLKKEGAEKYRTQNLPNCSSCPGVYELGIAVSSPQSGREVGKLNKKCIIPVYIGKADNVRTRLQSYGRGGAHLENGLSNGDLNDCKGRGLFTEIFSKGYSIVYRWAPMKNKRDAEKLESQLLYIFDYILNKSSNGARRPEDIHQKLVSCTSSGTKFPSIVKKLQIFPQRRVGLKIERLKPLLLENGSSFYTNPESNDILSQILKFGTSQPRVVSVRFGFDEDGNSICGVALGQGSVCTRLPVEGRKRCAEHKGMKVNGSTLKLITEGKSHVGNVPGGFDLLREPEYGGQQNQKFRYSSLKLLPAAGKSPVNDNCFPTCGVVLRDGSPCTREPVQGRKRCEEHKGTKIHGSVSRSTAEEKESYAHDPVLESKTNCNGCDRMSSRTHKPGKLEPQIFSAKRGVNKNFGIICGVDLKDGTFCIMQPVVGRERCEKHKGMRVNEDMSKFKAAEIPSVFSGPGVSKNTSSSTVINDNSSSTCGAATRDGSFCGRKPGEGSKWCWQHEGKSADRSSRTSACNESMFNATSSGSVPYTSFAGEGFSSTCGATTLDGSCCRRKPGNGSKWCWQHEGKSVDRSSRTSACNESMFNTTSSGSVPYTSFADEGFLSTCGATTLDGSFCRRKPGKGRKWCWQHEGTWGDRTSRTSYCNESTYHTTTSRSDSYRSFVDEGFSSTCGATTRNGSFCKRSPAAGRRTCWQH